MSEPVYRYSRNESGLQMHPALPNTKIMQDIMNNNKLMMSEFSDVIVKKTIDMEWKYLERRIIKWLGDNTESRKLQTDIKTHIKNEKKWIAKGAKLENAV